MVQLSRRLGLGFKASRQLIVRLADEGFLSKDGSKYSVIKTDATRSKVKTYFLNDLETLDDFISLMQNEPNYSSVRLEIEFK